MVVTAAAPWASLFKLVSLLGLPSSVLCSLRMFLFDTYPLATNLWASTSLRFDILLIPITLRYPVDF